MDTHDAELLRTLHDQHAHARLEERVARLESTLASIWRELLKVGTVTPHDDFFDLGGDSLLAVRVCERMQAATEVSLPPRACANSNARRAIRSTSSGWYSQVSKTVPSSRVPLAPK